MIIDENTIDTIHKNRRIKTHGNCAMCYTKIDVDENNKIYYHIYKENLKEVYKMGEPKNKLPYGSNGVMDFTRLWKALEIRGKNKQWLKENGIHSNTVAKLAKNENVTCEVLVNICKLLDCQPWDIMEYKKV